MSPSPRRCLRVAVSASVMSGGGFAAFSWMLEHGSGGEHAGNALLMLMVLFENFHAGYYRSKTRSILILNPLKTPVLLQGMISTCQIHVAALDTPGLPAVLMSEPVAPAVWARRSRWPRAFSSPTGVVQGGVVRARAAVRLNHVVSSPTGIPMRELSL